MAKGYHQVTQDTRSQIYALKTSGHSQNSIAEKLGFDRSTISRELRRNKGGRGYRPLQANEMAVARRSIASRKKKKWTPELQARVITELKTTDASPEQISGRLKREGILISHESIYQFIWDDKKAGGALYKHLRHHGKRYNKRSSGKAGRGCIPDRVDISERPKIVESKSRIGDWEGDTIIGSRHRGCILSYVDRHSKFTLLKKIERKTALFVHAATLEKMSSLAHPVLTITYDNGKEFALHKAIAAGLKASCFFAAPYHPWERGLNEHTNGLVRQYFPKLMDLSKIPEELIEEVEHRLNHRPRKSLDYKTPAEVFQELKSRLLV